MTRDTFDMFQSPDRGRFGENEDSSSRRPQIEGKSNLLDLDLFIHNNNPSKQAIAVSLDRQTPFAKWAWLPRSLIEIEVTGRDTARVTLPERLAREKGLI